MFTIDCQVIIYATYKKNKINIDVNLASHAHQVPQVGFPQILPVTNAIKVNIAPIGAIDFANKLKLGFLKINQQTHERARKEYEPSANQAAGTCIYIIRIESPCK